MYGTTMKSYNSSKNHKNFEQEVNEKQLNKKKENSHKTRYMKINERKYEEKNYESSECVKVEEGFSRKEFPIAPVVFTAIVTMITLLLTSGIFG